MIQFTCPQCHREFTAQSSYEEHLLKAHPKYPATAAHIDKLVRDVEFPVTTRELEDALKARGETTLLPLLDSLPDQQFRQADELTELLGKLDSYQPDPGYQAPLKSDLQAEKPLAASHVASMFEGLSFPASSQDVREYARAHVSEEELALIEQIREQDYQSLSEVEEEYQRVIGNLQET